MIRVRIGPIGLLCLGGLGCATQPAATDPAGVGEVPFASASEARSESPSPAPSPPAPPTPAVCSTSKVPGTLARADVVAVVDQGLGRWLGGIEVAPVHDEDRFVGWRIEAIGDACYRGVGIEPGDVVTRINRAALSTPEKANQIFLGLRSAPRLQVELVRGGVPRTLSWTITGP